MILTGRVCKQKEHNKCKIAILKQTEVTLMKYVPTVKSYYHENTYLIILWFNVDVFKYYQNTHLHRIDI